MSTTVATQTLPLPARRRAGALASPSVVLFLAMFASQSGVLVLSPILSDVADDLGVSIAAAGQLRILAAPLAAVVALAAARSLVRVSPRALIALGSALVAAGSLASAASPSFAVLAVAQVPMWAGIAILIAAGVAATAAWSEPETRTRVVAHAFAGPPAAWIVGMPLIGVAADEHWRIAFLVLPLPAAVLAAVAVGLRPGDAPIPAARTSLRSLLARVDARRWTVGELLVSSAWAGTLVYSGALFTERYGLSTTTTGIVLAVIASAYLAGNQWAGRSQRTVGRRVLIEGSLIAAAAVGVTWLFAPGVAVTVLLFATASAVVAARTVSGTVHGFAVAGERGREVGAVRAVTSQIAYLIGSLAGGLALAIGGFGLLAVAFGGLLLVSALPHLCLGRPCPCPTEPEPAT